MDSKFKNLFSRFSAVFFNNGALKVALFAVLLFIGISHISVPVERCPGKAASSGNNVYTGVLTVNRDCEVPALRSRFGQQLQLNCRTTRSSQSWNLHRNDHFEGNYFPELRSQIIRLLSDLSENRRENSSYHAYSKYSLPVRAGPLSATTEQSFFI